jgi:peptide/nickel transport system substrate-binding protein
VTLELRPNAFWHDGSPVTPEDVVWTLETIGKPTSGNPVFFVWAGLGNFQVSGNTITADVKAFEPALFQWMAFLSAYILPKAYFTKVGAEGFEKKPIGSGPYMVDEFQSGSFVRLKAFDKYWGGKPPFDTVVFKFVPDATSRVAEIESGGSDLTLEIPYEDFDRLKTKANLTAVTTPVSDIGMIFLTNVAPMLDKNVRLALHHAIDKKAIVQRLLRGYGIPIDTLLTPDYVGYDASVTVKYAPKLAAELMAKSGYTKEKPLRFTIQTTRGFKPKDYEMIQAIVGMWRNIGAEAQIEIYEIAKHFELRSQHKLAPAAFYNWGNSIGDPSTSIAHAMASQSPNSAWRTPEMDAVVGPLWAEKDEGKRIAGYKKASRYIADEGLVIPLLQYVQPIVYKKGLKFTPHKANLILPQTISA